MKINELLKNTVKLIPSKEKIILPISDTQMGEKMAGFSQNADDLTQGKMSIKSTDERILIGDATEPMTGIGIFMGKDTADYEFRAGDPSGNYIHWDGTNLNVSGIIVIGGTIRYGKTSFTDSVNAGYYIGAEGLYIGSASDASLLKYTLADGSFNFIGTVSSRSTATIASAIDASGHFVDAVLSTASKTILSDFTFSPSDYSGAFKTGNITWNSTTGAITGGTGIVINKLGIIGASAGVTKFSILTDGNATFAGTLSGASGTFGTITGGALNINDKFIVTASGDTTLKSVSIINQFTAGENLTIGTLGVFINSEKAWGNGPYSDRSDAAQTVVEKMVYIDSASPDTNYATEGGLNQPLLGTNAGGECRILVKLNLTDSPPGLPFANEVESVKFRVFVKTATTNANSGNVTLQSLAANFTENTVTWNTKPAGGNFQATGAVYTTMKGEGVASTADLKNIGYIEFDITQMYRMWTSSSMTNYGFEIMGSGVNAGSSAVIGGRTYEGLGGPFLGTPYVACIIIKNNPGSGNVMTACDGKVYIASNASYQRIKNIAGVIGATVSADATVDIYSLSDGFIIPNSVITIDSTQPNRKYFLTGSTGGIGILTADIVENDKWDIKIGKSTATGLICESDKKPIFIKSESIITGGILPPPGASIAVVKWNMSATVGANTTDHAGVLKLEKDRLTSLYETRGDGVSWAKITIAWASGTYGLLSLTGTEDGYDSMSVSGTVYWYG